MHMVKAGVMEDIYAHNNHIAEHVREYLMKRNVYTINVMGAPGTGKTTSLEQLMKHMKSKVYVIEGDIESDIDTERLRKENVTAAQINTFGACHLDAPLVHNAVHTMDFKRRKPGVPGGTEHRGKYQNAHRQRSRWQRQALQIPPGL